MLYILHTLVSRKYDCTHSPRAVPKSTHFNRPIIVDWESNDLPALASKLASPNYGYYVTLRDSFVSCLTLQIKSRPRYANPRGEEGCMQMFYTLYKMEFPNLKSQCIMEQSIT